MRAGLPTPQNRYMGLVVMARPSCLCPSQTPASGPRPAAFPGLAGDSHLSPPLGHPPAQVSPPDHPLPPVPERGPPQALEAAVHPTPVLLMQELLPWGQRDTAKEALVLSLLSVPTHMATKAAALTAGMKGLCYRWPAGHRPPCPCSCWNLGVVSVCWFSAGERPQTPGLWAMLKLAIPLSYMGIRRIQITI